MHADAGSLDAAVSEARGLAPVFWGPGCAAPKELRSLVLGSQHSRTSAERHLRRQLQQRLEACSVDDIKATSQLARAGPSAASALWAVELQQFRPAAAAAGADSSSCSPGTRLLLGRELARGGALPERRAGGMAQAVGGSTQMKPELALASANLAALPKVRLAA